MITKYFTNIAVQFKASSAGGEYSELSGKPALAFWVLPPWILVLTCGDEGRRGRRLRSVSTKECDTEPKW